MDRRDNMIKTICFLVAGFAASSAAVAAEAVAAPPKDEFKFEFHGLIGSSVYGQVGNFLPTGGGQAAWLVVPPELSTDKFILGGDVRQSRMGFSITGPSIPLACHSITPKGMIEMDFFGGTSFGNFGDASLFPRLRILYAEFVLGDTTLRFGQDHQLVLGTLLPTTVGHMAFPLTFQAGTIGWRYPGIAVFHNLPVAEGRMLELSLQVTKSPWVVKQTSVVTNATATPNTTTAIPGAFGTDNGTASGLPAIEARVKYKSKPLEAFVAGHFSQVDKSGPGASYPSDDKRNVLAANLGFKLALAPVTLLASGYVGKNTAPLLGTLLQFQALDQAIGDIKDFGAWGQIGVNITSDLSAWALLGFEKPNRDDVIAAKQTRLQNTVSSVLLRYQRKGMTVGLEYTYWATKNLVDEVSGVASSAGYGKMFAGHQLMLSGMYFF